MAEPDVTGSFTGSRARAGHKEWTGLAMLVLPCLLVSMDLSVLFLALPFISADLAPTGTQQLWMMDIYGFVLAGMLITMGAVGDRIGRRRLLIAGAGAFGVASLAAAHAGSAEALIAARAVLGLAGATLMPSTLALIRTMFHDPLQRKTAVAIWTGGMTGGAVIGPIVGGFLLEHYWWGSAFLVNVPAMALLLVLGPVLLPEFRAPAPGRFDLPGALLSLAAVIAAIYGVKETAVNGFEPLPLLCLVGGLLLGAAFLRRQRRAAAPLIEPALLRRRTFGTSLAVNTVVMFGFIGGSLHTNQYLQLVLGMRPFAAALWSLVVVPAIVAGITLSGALARRMRPGHVLAVALSVAAGGFVLLAALRPDSPLWLFATAVSALASGVLMAATLTADMVLTAAPPERAGAASALSETGSELGGALGMAVLGSVGAAVYGGRMAEPSIPGLSPEAARTAGDTLAAAVAAAARVPGPAGDALLRAARDAFTEGMNVTAAAGAVVMAATAVLAMVLLRRVEPGTAARTASPAEPAVRACGPAAAPPGSDQGARRPRTPGRRRPRRRTAGRGEPR
ncbi:MFS transporter [Sphaerisporangium siamense]|uniref:DHA2 family multidrug resistance protein-like MFS transporter n=1 Tax=Sphaerisporangium siamense TaxID=795645 RepID=A0A7W7DBB9_9ACTN|nr:MFS transporter [Sphaerisporangium siamense]MBB4703677.1 DHA2 family multidrug resistance protein-like MFS transporter [Sphaerisporangium siamense]GII82149.1 MFS transporter [Sphaerisporangium siamense]